MTRVFLILGLLAGHSRAEVIDRIAVTLDNQVITESEILREIRLTAFLNGDALDFSADAKRKAADRLVEQKLIRKEIEVGHYVAPAAAEVEPMLKQIQSQRFENLKAYNEAVEKYRVTEDDLKAHLVWQATLLRFIDTRFRPGIQISDIEIHQYFDKELPSLEKQAGRNRRVSLDELRDKIEETLTDERIDKQMDDWLKEARKRTRVDYRAEVFK
jgi:hypothetical protein